MSGAMEEQEDLVSRLLDTNATLGILAGLTAIAAAGERNDDDGDDDDNDDDALTLNPRLLGPPSARNANDKKRWKSLKSGSRQSPTDSAASPSTLVPAAKKYSVQEQRGVIRKLQERNQILKQELSIESRDAKQLLAHEKRQRVEYLQKATEMFTKKVDAAKKAVAKLDELIAKKEHELETLRQQQYHGGGGSGDGPSSASGQLSSEWSSGGSGGGQAGETGTAITRRVRSLENRLELSLVKRNEMDSVNKHFRAQIEKVRKDRVLFDGIYKKLEKELSDFQARYDASVGELRKATEAKEQVDWEIQQIQQQAGAEQRQYDVEFKELRHVIETAMRDVQEANARLGGAGAVGLFGEREDGLNPVAGAKTLSRGIAGAGHSTPVGVVAPSPADSPLKRISAVSSWKIGFDKALTTTSDSIVSKYDQIFDGIKKMTGITDITKIAQAITRMDEDNFKRFKHVEELHREEADLKAQLEQLTQVIDEFKAKEGIATGVTQKQQYRTLETKYHHMLEKNQAFDVDYEETTNKLTRIKSSVHSIHSMLVHANCAKNADQFSLHGGSNLALGSHSARDITDTNVLDYLQAIEIFTSSLMKENHESSAAATTSALENGVSPDLLASVSSPIGQGPSTLPSDPAQKLRVQVPSFGGLNGAIILPASTPLAPHTDSHGRHLSTSALQQQQQQRKKTARFEILSRIPPPQQQFAATLTASMASSGSPAPSSATSPTSSSSFDDALLVHTPMSSVVSTTSGDLSAFEDDDDERAYTYEELRHLAAKHIVKKCEEPIDRLASNHGATTRSGALTSPVKAAR